MHAHINFHDLWKSKFLIAIFKNTQETDNLVTSSVSWTLICLFNTLVPHSDPDLKCNPFIESSSIPHLYNASNEICMAFACGCHNHIHTTEQTKWKIFPSFSKNFLATLHIGENERISHSVVSNSYDPWTVAPSGLSP